MEMVECQTEFPHTHMDLRPRKRPRLACLDVVPEAPKVKVPAIVVGCKLDAREDKQISLEQMMSPILQQFREIETCIECSARNLIQVVSHDQIQGKR